MCDSLILLSSLMSFSRIKLSVASFSLSGVGTRTTLSFYTSFMTSLGTSTSLGKEIQSSIYLRYFSIITIRFFRSGWRPTLLLKVASSSTSDFLSSLVTPKYFYVCTLMSTSTAMPSVFTSLIWWIFLTTSTI